MSFREKSSWIHMVILIVVYGNYFAWLSRDGMSGPEALRSLLWLTVVFVVLEIVVFSIAAALSPDDANAPEDEREKIIRWRSGEVAGYVLAGGALFALFIVQFDLPSVIVGQVILGSLVLSSVVDCAGQIIQFRRQA